MKNSKNSITKTAFKMARERLVILSLPLAFFAILTFGVLMLSFFFPILLFVGVPFIVIPSFFAVAAINTISSNENVHEGIGFFIMFRAYFSQIFRGGYKVIFGFLKALLTYVVSSSILIAIFSATILNKDPEYIAFIEQINAITDPNQISQLLLNFVDTNQTFNTILFISDTVGSFLAFYIFMHHFSINSFKYNYNFTSKMPLPMQDLNLIFKDVLKRTRKDFYKEYYKSTWFLGLILIIGFAVGVLIPYFFINNIDVVQINTIGLGLSFTLLLFFVPYFVNVSNLIFAKYRPMYFETLIDLSKKSLEELKKNNAISEDKEKEILSVIESQKDEDDKD